MLNRTRRAIARRRPGWSDRNFILILAARTTMSGARALAGVITPVYLALEGFTAERLGILLAVVAVSSALLSTLIGVTSDRVGRKPFLVVVPLFAGLAGVAFAFDRTAWVLFLAAALGSFGRGSGASAGAVGPYQPAESAFVAESLPPQQRNSAFGQLSFCSSLGALGGGLLALLASEHHLHGAAATAAFRDAFLATAVLAVAAGLLALFLSEERRAAPDVAADPAGSGTGHGKTDRGGATPEQVAAGAATQERRGFAFPHRSRALLYRLWATNSVNGFAVGMFGPFVSYWFFRRFDIGAGEIGTLFAVVNAATAASTLSAARLARRWGLVSTVTVVRFAQGLLLVPMVLAPNLEVAGAIYLLRMVVQRIGLPLRQSYVLAMADPAERGAVTALSNLPSQLTMAGSPVLAGYLFDEVSLVLPFDLAAIFQAANAGMFWAFFHNAPPEEERVTLTAAGGAPSAVPPRWHPSATAPRNGRDPQVRPSELGPPR